VAILALSAISTFSDDSGKQNRKSQRKAMA
jgi:hypothetical protein